MNKAQIIETANGNPGAATVLMILVSKSAETTEEGLWSKRILEKIASYPTLKGTNLYVFWNDLANQELFRAAYIIERVPQEILEDACSRQDYSGRALINPYL